MHWRNFRLAQDSACDRRLLFVLLARSTVKKNMAKWIFEKFEVSPQREHMESRGHRRACLLKRLALRTNQVICRRTCLEVILEVSKTPGTLGWWIQNIAFIWEENLWVPAHSGPPDEAFACTRAAMPIGPWSPATAKVGAWLWHCPCGAVFSEKPTYEFMQASTQVSAEDLGDLAKCVWHVWQGLNPHQECMSEE